MDELNFKAYTLHYLYKYNIVNVVKHHKHILLLKIPNLNADGNFTLPIYQTVHLVTLVTMIDIFFKYSEYRLSVIRSYKGGPPKCPDVAHFLFLTALPSVNVISSTYFSCIYLYYLEKKKKKKLQKFCRLYFATCQL